MSTVAPGQLKVAGISSEPGSTLCVVVAGQSGTEQQPGRHPGITASCEEEGVSLSGDRRWKGQSVARTVLYLVGVNHEN